MKKLLIFWLIILVVVILLVSLFLPLMIKNAKADSPYFRLNFRIDSTIARTELHEQDFAKKLPDGTHPWVDIISPQIDLLAAPFIKDGQIWLALRDVFNIFRTSENPQASVISYDSKNQQVIMIYQKDASYETKIELTIGKPIVLQNGKEIIINMSPFIQDGRTFVPLNFLTQVMGAKEIFCSWATDWIIVTWPLGI